MPSATKTERAEAIERLRAWVKPGDTIHCILRHVSRSGMQRVIQLVKLETEYRGSVSDGTYRAEVRDIHIGWTAATALGMRYDRQREGVVIGGCGMDMGFALVYDLASTLFSQGWECLGENCPSNVHSNHTCKCGAPGYDHSQGRTLGNYGAIPDGSCKRYVRDDPRGPGVMHKDGGYALRYRWL